ncbi:MAG: 5-deoxy-glucuronate isomerase [Christensenellaceae bacterium]|jgi:5-deoxy-glucuronate isomerase|nr:5-deoxy-glucuronate isomerase [Christensenellaceae bacterium]
MYLEQNLLKNGWNTCLSAGAGQGGDAGMDVALLLMEPGDTYEFDTDKNEAALLLFAGEAAWGLPGALQTVRRQSEFTEEASCLHVPCASHVVVQAKSHCEIYVQMVANPRAFAPVFYGPSNVQIQRAGQADLAGTMRRDIKTVFDFDNAPYSNMVLGEVLSYPGRWSSYPPHHHPQPEVYFYRFDKPQGFGVGFANGEVHQIGHNGLLLIQNGCHEQVTAPGYGLCYVWGIRHLPGDPWKKTRIDDLEHVWMLQPGATFLEEK